MKNPLSTYLPLLLISGCLVLPARLQAEPCGENAISCGADEQCCVHRIATFCQDQSCGYTYDEGACVPQGEKCADYWCGTAHCQASWLGARNVCCVYQRESQAASYSCARHELSCPGSSDHLTIRPAVLSKSPA
jgi:hypothetical protein